MAGSKKLEVQIIGDASSLSRAFGNASKSSSKFGSTMMKVGKFAAIGLAGGIAGAAVAMKKSVDAALEAEKAQTRLDSAFKSAGVAARDRADAMREVAKVSVRAGLDDEDLMDTLGRLTRVTGSAAKAQRDMAIAADLARARNLSLEAATKIVEKAELGNVGALKRIGIEIPKVTAAQDALRESHSKATAEQIKAAKAADDTATRQSAIAALQKQYAGSAEAYGNTAAGAQDRFKVAVENLQETLGAKLLPVITRVLEWTVAHMPQFERVATAVFSKVGAVIDALKPVFAALVAGIRIVVAAARAYWPQVQEAAAKVVAWYKGTLQPAINNVITAVKAIWQKFGGDITRMAASAFNTIKTIITSALRIIQGVIEGVLAVIRGDWSQAWNSLKQVVTNVLTLVKAGMTGFAKVAFIAMVAVGRAMIDGIIAGLAGLFGAVKDKIVGGVKGAISAAGGILHGSGAFMFTKHAVGEPLAQGIALGFIKGMKATNATLSREMVAMAAQLTAINARREREDLAAAVRSAAAAVAEARKKKTGVVEAERELARAREDIVVAGLTRQLAKEQVLYDKRQEMIQKAQDKMNAALQKAQEKAAATFSKMQDKIMRAFDSTRGGMVTPAEAELAAIADRRRGEDLQKALADAVAGGDAGAIARAQEDIRINSLERQAATERTALDQQTEALRENLQERLAVWKGGTSGILKMLQGFGVDFGTVGALLGSAFRESLIASINGASKAAGGKGGVAASAGGAARPLMVNVQMDSKTVAQLLVDPLRETAQQFNARNGRSAFA